ncbi:MAG TPA: transcription elongation factor GreA [Oscillospiraceae bacterium]|nr:transcription elongation factor GreA [Oscillospiraceae bacterium]HPS75516.1 transcription elongation factor GreA [Oscillospiraceae bacterium]
MADSSRYKMSQERLDDLKKELEYLETVREKEVSELIKEARSFGDLSENSEYDEAKTEQGKLYSKIAEYKDLIENVEIVDKVVEVVVKDAVVLGSRIKLHDAEEGCDEDFEIVGSQEANPMHGRISDDSPLGRCLIGHRAGDTVSVENQFGTQQFKILAVTND